MRKKIYYLSTCSTNARIMKEVGVDDSFEKQEIKTQPIQPEQLEEMKEKAGSYEALFSRVAMKYKAWGLKDKKLTEMDYKDYILQEYTFLRRPVFLIGNEIFVGNAPKTIAALKEALKK